MAEVIGLGVPAGRQVGIGEVYGERADARLIEGLPLT